MPPPTLPDINGLSPAEIDTRVNSPEAQTSWAAWRASHGLGNPAAPGYAPPTGSPVSVQPPAAGIDPGNRGDKAQAAVSGCARQLCIPRPTIGNLSVTAGGASYTPAEPICACVSDLIIYSVSIGAVLIGAWAMFLTRR